MVKLLIIDKLGSIGELNIKNLLREDLYKKCNYRKSAGFELLNTWKIKHKQEYIIEIHGKRDGKAGLENKYEFPPPVDNELYFGNIALVSVNEEGKLLDITGEEWLTIYDKLYGGFEDLDATAKEDEMEEDELKNVPDDMKTSGGYLKDGFVVDDDDSGEGECVYDSELDYEEYEFSDEDYD